MLRELCVQSYKRIPENSGSCKVTQPESYNGLVWLVWIMRARGVTRGLARSVGQDHHSPFRTGSGVLILPHKQWGAMEDFKALE